MPYYTYITTNPSHTTLYTGITNNLARRVAEHYASKGQPQTFAGRYHCYKLVWFEMFESRMDAILMEKRIKGWTRVRKNQLISSANPEWQELLV